MSIRVLAGAFFLPLLLSGCISFTSVRNTQFSPDTMPKSGVAYREINVCRPFSMIKGLEYAGLYVNDQPAAEVGSRNRLQVNVPIGATLIKFVTPRTLSSIKSVDFGMQLPDAQQPVYLILTVSSVSNESFSIGNFTAYKGTSLWEVKQISQQEFESKCSSYSKEILTDKALLKLTDQE